MNLISSGLDQKIKSDSIAAAGEKYHTITSLTVRQSFGATQLVGTKDSTYMFMKEISSNGNTQTVDVVFPLHPIILYTNPTLLKYLLEPFVRKPRVWTLPKQIFDTRSGSALSKRNRTSRWQRRGNAGGRVWQYAHHDPCVCPEIE